jgi:hypothetical protein
LYNGFSQNLEANYWYLGIKSGVKFLPSPSVFPNNNISTHIGEKATISTKRGDLLFYLANFPYRDSIINSSHRPIMGNPFSNDKVVEGLIQKLPSSFNKHLFIYSNGSRFIRFITIIMNGPSDPGYFSFTNGDYGTLPYTSASSLSVLDHSNGTDKWLVFHSDSGDIFYSYPITLSGIQTSQFNISRVGIDIPWVSTQQKPAFNSKVMKCSPNSEYLAISYLHSYNTTEVFKFNRQLGIIDSLICKIRHPTATDHAIVFSPNSKYLFIAQGREINAYDISKSDSTSILNSKIRVFEVDSNYITPYIADIQLAVDGNAYFINGSTYAQQTKKLSRILCPDQIYDTIVVQDTVLGPVGVHFGTRLPTLNQTLYVNAHKLQAQNLGPAVACAGSPSQLVAYGASKDDFSWSPSTGLSCSNCSSPIATPLTTTTYRVIARATSCKQDKLDTAFVTVSVKDPPPNATLNADSVVCAGDSLPLYMARPHYFLVWSTGDTADTLFAKQPGLYSATAYGYCFAAPVSRQVYVRPQPALAVSPRDTTVCAGEPVLLRASTPDTALQWLTFATTDTLRVSAPGVYVAQVQNACGILTDTAIVRHSQPSAQFVADSTEGFAPFAFSAFSKPGKLQRRWLLNGQDVGSDSVLRVINLPTDTYDLVLAVMDSIGCTDTSRLQLKVFPPPVPPEPPVPEPEPEPETTDSTHRDCQIKVFPNPFHTEFVVKALVSTHQIKEVQLVSAEGKILFEEAMPAGVNPLHLHLSSHPAAVYMLNYSCKGNTYRVKVVKD